MNNALLWFAVLLVILIGLYVAQRASNERHLRRVEIHERLMELRGLDLQRGLSYDEISEQRELLEEMEALQ